MSNLLVIFSCLLCFISHLYFNSELGCQFGPDFSLGPGSQGLSPPAGPQPTGPGGLGDPGPAATLRACSQLTEARVQVDLLGACSNVAWKPEMLFFFFFFNNKRCFHCFFKKIIFLLKYSWFIMCQSLLYSKVTQLYTYNSFFKCSFPLWFITGYWIFFG